jgi:hypothetical protein
MDLACMAILIRASMFPRRSASAVNRAGWRCIAWPSRRTSCNWQNEKAILAHNFEAAAALLHRQDKIDDRLTELVRRLIGE